MSSKDGAWPWGIGYHVEDGGEGFTRCNYCAESCADPILLSDVKREEEAYRDLCPCCREPLYQLRIAELENELAKFYVCDESEGCFDDRGRLHGPQGWEYVGMALVEGGVARCTVYHKGEESWGV